MTQGRIIKGMSNQFLVDVDNQIITCSARKKIKHKSDLLVGDYVMVDKEESYVIDKILPRKNSLIRPPIANIDQLIITIAPIPEIDFFLIDKLIINAHKQSLSTVICLNKMDIADEMLFGELKEQYNGVVDHILKISAVSGKVQSLQEALRGKLSCFAGQSAVGKSSIINCLTGDNRVVGALSEKNSRGKNTTTTVELIKLDSGTYIADSPGFSMLDIHYLQYDELCLHYGEYVELSNDCKFSKCAHVAEPYCAVKNAVEKGLLNKKRYERYVQQVEQLKMQNELNKYKKTIY